MRGCDLQGKMVCDETGRKLGRLQELHIREGVVTTLVCGPMGLLQRFSSARKGRRIPWRAVQRIEARQIVVARSGGRVR